MFDWFGRTVALILSAVATFATIAALVSVSGPRMPGLDRPPLPGDTAVPALPSMPEEMTEAPSGPLATPGHRTGGQAPVAARVAEPDAERWLPALTYALIAIAGFAGAMLVVLMRISAQLADIARRR